MSRKQLSRSGGDLGALGHDDIACTMLHVDMDAFFASVELLTRPELRGRPVIVGGVGNRGVVTSATYEARDFGVHAAMPMTRARDLCPQAIVIPPSRGEYSRYSRLVREILERVTDQVFPVSIDEGFVEVSAALRRMGSPTAIARWIRERVFEETGLTCSVGVASTMLVAKLASTRAKPDGMLVVPIASVDQFLRPMPVEALPGVGPATQDKFRRYGVRTVADLADMQQAAVERSFGSHGLSLWHYAHGRDRRSGPHESKDPSMSAERTFGSDLTDLTVLEGELLGLCEKVAERLRSHGQETSVLGLKLRRSDFSTVSRSLTLRAPSDVGLEMYHALAPLLRKTFDERADPVRLLGMRAAGLSSLESTGRHAMLDEPESGRREAETAADEVRAKFGTAALGSASRLRARRGVGNGRRREDSG